jgi:hypothetical protein
VGTLSITTKIYGETLLYSQRTSRFGLKKSIIRLRVNLENINMFKLVILPSLNISTFTQGWVGRNM